MPKIDLDAMPDAGPSRYPPPFDKPMAGRSVRRLGPASGLTVFTASHVVMAPGSWSSQRHWHDSEDEFLVLLSGEATLIEDDGETIMRAGDCAAFPAGSTNGHHLVNRSAKDCIFVAIGGGVGTGGGYSDIDMLFTEDNRYTRKDGTDYHRSRA